MDERLKITLTAAELALATQANAQAVFYEQDNFQGRLPAPSLATFLVTRSGAAAARISPPSAAPSPGLRWVPRWAAAEAHSLRRRKTCSAAKAYPARPNPSFGMSATTFGARRIGFS